MKKSGLLVVILGALLLVGAAVCVRLWINNVKAKANREFRQDAIAEVRRLTEDTAWVQTHISGMTNEIAWQSAWFSQKLIVMKNREWIVCQAGCTKSNRKIDDIFIGKASDGKWYYTTYHFCILMSWLEGNGPEKSLAAFVERYELHEFTGEPTAALPHNKTLPKPILIGASLPHK